METMFQAYEHALIMLIFPSKCGSKLETLVGIIRCKSQYPPSPKAPSVYTSPCLPHISGKHIRAAVPSEMHGQTGVFIKSLALARSLDLSAPSSIFSVFQVDKLFAEECQYLTGNISPKPACIYAFFLGWITLTYSHPCLFVFFLLFSSQ